MPSSYDSTGPGSFLNNFTSDDQLFQQPLFNAIGQNYVPNARPPPYAQSQPQSNGQRDTTFDNSYARLSPPHRQAYLPPQQSINNNTNNPYQQQPPPSVRTANYPNNNDPNNDPFADYHEMYSSSQYQRPPPPAQKQQYLRPPPQQTNFDEPLPRTNYSSNNQEMFFTDHNDDQLDQISFRQHEQQPTQSMANQRHVDQQNEQDSKRQGKIIRACFYIFL